jgi:hypothetical protein
MRGSRQEILISIALVALTLAVFGRTCRNDFVNYDDTDYVTRNPYVMSGLAPQSISWAFTTLHASNWHPLTWLSLELDAQIYGLQPWGFHLTNVFLHAANTVMLFWALTLMTGGIRVSGDADARRLPADFAAPRLPLGTDAARLASALVAALFAVHPLHVESVSWVAERKDLLSGFFWMLTLVAYARYAASPSWTRYAMVVAGFAAGLLAKPMLVTLPFVLLLLD